MCNCNNKEMAAPMSKCPDGWTSYTTPGPFYGRCVPPNGNTTTCPTGFQQNPKWSYFASGVSPCMQIPKQIDSTQGSSHATNSIPTNNPYPVPLPPNSTMTMTGTTIPVVKMVPTDTPLQQDNFSTFANTTGNLFGTFLTDAFSIPLNSIASFGVSLYRGNSFLESLIDGIVGGASAYGGTAGSLYVEASMLSPNQLASSNFPYIHVGVKGAIFAVLQSGYNGYLVSRNSYTTYSKELCTQFAQSAIIDMGMYFFLISKSQH